MAGYQKTPLVGAYLPPSTLDHLPELEEVPNRFPGRYPIILGGPERGHRPLKEPLGSTGCCLLGVIWVGGPLSPFPATPLLPPHSDVVAGPPGTSTTIMV